MEVALRFSTLRRLLVAAIGLVAYAGLCAEIWDDVLYYEDPFDLVEFFGLSYEKNLPTWFVSCLLSACGGALALIALQTRRAGGDHVAHWWGLAAAFFYISLDETATLHEELGSFFSFESSVLYYGWVVPAAVIVSLFGLAYLGFLRALPRLYARRFALAGAIYVSGALLMELPLGWWAGLHGTSNLGYGLIDWVEETLELVGAGFFLLTLLRYLAGERGRIEVRLREEPVPPRAPTRRLGALAALWAAFFVATGVLYLTGRTEYHRYTDAQDRGANRAEYVGEHLGPVLRGGEAYRYRGSLHVFDRQVELRAGAIMALLAGTGMMSGVLALRRRPGSD